MKRLVGLLLYLCFLSPTSADSPPWIPLGSIDAWNNEVLSQVSETFLILGETHGTAEAPRAALGLASSLSARGQEVVLAVEWPKPMQDAVSSRDLKELKRDPLFTRPDGRSSQSMVSAVLSAQARSIPVRCFDAFAETAQARDEMMAKNLMELQAENPQARIVVLVGNYHSRLEMPQGATHTSMAMRLQERGASAVSILVAAPQGEAWNSIDQGTGVQSHNDQEMNNGLKPAFRRLKELWRGHQAVLALQEFRASPPWHQPQEDNQELAQLFAEDQAARKESQIDWSVVSQQDAVRRAQVRKMLEQDMLKTGQDFYHAAFIFQHGGEPESYLLAHILAEAAMIKGHPEACWIAAATLDRYLHNTDRDQVFGTQYTQYQGEWSQGKYEPDFLGDNLRKLFKVRSLEEQKDMLRQLQQR